MGIYLLTCK